jgi:chorismate mutase
VDKSEALKLLHDSRNKIDQIDDEIIDLIQKRTSLAKNIATAKMVLDKNVEDKEREDYIQHKIREIAREKNIDEISLQKKIKILTDLSKIEQEKILRR